MIMVWAGFLALIQDLLLETFEREFLIATPKICSTNNFRLY